MNSDNCLEAQLKKLAEKSYATIASCYPICSCSDEFYFFPQVVLKDRDWSHWDDFSEARVAEFADMLYGYEQDLDALDKACLTAAGQVDAELLQQVLKTLREQLTLFAPHKSQPTFHLTILAAGLAEALDSKEPDALDSRLAGVPEFLRRAGECLQAVPEVFRSLGFEMLHDLQNWIASLQIEGLSVDDLFQPLIEFKSALQALTPGSEYRLREELLEVLLREHLQCGITADEIVPILRDELEEMEEALDTETARLSAGKSWVEAERQKPFVAVSGTDLRRLYHVELRQMEAHCRQHGMVADSLSGADLSVAPVPEYLSAVRASDAYAATPGFPPQGGVFYVMEEGRNRDGQPGRTLEYRMTAAHEAWPGHHLLDVSRWSLERPLRRPVESPLFYEGWACLAEELMARTGYFKGPWDRFLLAKRRAERAARGMVDIGLQSGQMTIVEARELLLRVGYERAHADSVVLKYLLRPGYQVCYTLGLKQGLGLLERFGRQDIGDFSHTLLQQGEIGFSRLEKIFQSKIKSRSLM